MRKTVFKLFCALALTLGLAGCCDCNEPSNKTEVESTDEVLYINVPNDVSFRFQIVDFEYRGHKYILFRGTETKNGVVHDPDCPCRNKKEKENNYYSSTTDWDW
jgi:hypothetical protein